MIARLIIYFFALSCICCTTSILNLTDNNYNPHSRNPNLRIDGFYYKIDAYPDSQYVSSIIYLYKNNIVYYQGSKSYTSLDLAKNDIINLNTRDNKIGLQKSDARYYGHWGHVNYFADDSIKMYTQILGEGRRWIEKFGKIVNDSTLVFYRGRNSMKLWKWIELDKPSVYKFVKTDFKPDSTNIFYK